VLPLERREARRRFIRNGLPAIADRGDRRLQVDGIPKHDGGDYEVQPTRPVPLVLVGAVAEFTQPVEEHRLGQGVSGFPLVQPDVDPSPQFDTADVLEQEKGREKGSLRIRWKGKGVITD